MSDTGAKDEWFRPPSGLRPVQYQPHALTFSGPFAGEMDSAPNPFLDYRLNVSFRHESGLRYDNVPGYFNGDGAGGAGSKWKVLFTPPLAGAWKYVASFRAGQQVAVSLDPLDGTPLAFDGSAGVLEVQPLNPDAPGFLAKGMLRHDGFYPRFDNGEYFVKAGMNSPENFLGFSGFDNTPEARHDYAAHTVDWQQGDPDWNNGAGKPIIGLLNYFASTGLNSIFFLPMNIGGDGRDTWPFAGEINPNGAVDNDNVHYDLSKLDQWDTVFSHAQRKGIKLHIVLNEAEEANKRELDDATLGVERKLFYREMIARFGHHNALQWNISEEYDHYRLPLDPQEMLTWAGYIKDVDPYDHPITIHNFDDPDVTFTPFLGDDRITATSFQFANSAGGRGEEVEKWRQLSQASGHPIHISLDELRATTTSNLDAQRFELLWPTLLSGGSVEFYFGGQPELDMNDFRPYDDLWRWSGIALDVMEALPFWTMIPDDTIQSGEYSSSSTGGGNVFYKPGDVYAVHLARATETGVLDLTGDDGTFDLTWINPRTGEQFPAGQVQSSSATPLGPPPDEPEEDWVALLRKTSGTLNPPAAPTRFALAGLSDDSVTLAWSDVASNETSYRIEMSTDGVVFKPTATLPPDSTSAVIDDLQPGTTYHFRLRAHNTAGDAASPSAITGTTAATADTFATTTLQTSRKRLFPGDRPAAARLPGVRLIDLFFREPDETMPFRR